MVMPSWWEEGAANVIKTAKKYVKIKWDAESAPGDQKSSPVFLLEQDCRKLLEWKDGVR